MTDRDLPNVLDRAIAWLAPATGARRARDRIILAYYEAATPTRLRKGRTAPGTGNLAVERAGRSLREQARYFEQNYDLARGILAELVGKTVGPMGIMPEPQPRTADGEIHDEFASELLELHNDFAKRPEVTWQHDLPAMQRLQARSWFRDGEVFSQMVSGFIPTLDHGSIVPFSIEMIECDLVPLEYQGTGIAQGIETNAWGRPRAYWTLLQPPGDILFAGASILPSQVKRIPAERMLHAKMVDRIRQLRGVSMFATVLGRLDDLKDYEESERIAAKVAASMAAYIKKGLPDDYAPVTNDNADAGDGSPEGMRDMKFRPGMIFDDLRVGEEIGTIDTKRPNANLLPYRQGQLRGAASGTNTQYSSIAKSYDGTYSAQRQELVEAWSSYAILQSEFINAIVRPTYEQFVAVAVASGKIKVPREVVPASVDDAIYIGPQMPWIDPESEMNAMTAGEGAGYISAPEIIRRRGGSPRDVLIQEARWRRQCKDKELVFTPQQVSAANQNSQAALQRKAGT
ncbi:MAG: phage portal protein [Betaproteobacteria bacterium]